MVRVRISQRKWQLALEDIEIKDDLYRHGPDFKALNSSLMSEPGKLLVLLIHKFDLNDFFPNRHRGPRT